MILHRPLDPATLSAASPGGERSPFKASWSDTLTLLQREVDHLALAAHERRRFEADAWVEVDLPPSAIRLDGGIKGNAPRHRTDTVAVTIPTPKLGELRLVSARYTTGASWCLPGWQANVRAVALTLEALRSVERWGAATGQQYRGFAAIGATSTGTALGAGLTRTDALTVLARAAGMGPDDDPEMFASLDTSADTAARLYRRAARRHHPDAGGDPALFARLTEARDLLAATR